MTDRDLTADESATLERLQTEWNDSLLGVDAGLPISRDLLVLVGIHQTPDGGSSIPPNQLTYAWMLSVIKLEQRVLALEREVARLSVDNDS